MSLTLPIDELSRFRVSAKLAIDGRIALTLHPVPENNTYSGTQGRLYINFETLVEEGSSSLSIFTTSDTLPSQALTKEPTHVPEPPKNTPTSAPTNQSGQMPSGSTNAGMLATSSNTSWISDWTDDFLSNFNSQAFIGTSETEENAPVFPNFSPNDMNFSDQTNTLNLPNDVNHCIHDSLTLPGPTFQTENLNRNFTVKDPFFCQSPSTSISSILSTNSSPQFCETPLNHVDGDHFIPEIDSSASSPSSPPTPQATSVRHRRRRLSCLQEGCTRQFVSEHTRRVHMRTHQPKPRQSFPCTMGCPEAFSRQHDRLRHEVSKHGRQCQWSCNICRKFFSSEKTLDNHRCAGHGSISRWIISADQVP